MLIKTMPLGHLQANCYIVTDEATLECAVIDPGGESNTVLDYLEDNKLKCKYILLTHGHFDHTGAVEEVQRSTGATIAINAKDAAKNALEMMYKYKVPPCGAEYLKDGDMISVGNLLFEVITTPGHSKGGLTFRCGDALFTGDTLFRDSCGRTDFPGCDGEEMMKSLKKLAELEGDFDVYPGHMEATTLERERRCNFFVQEAMK